MGLIFDIQRFSLHDGPGIRTTVFLKGCPLNCFWCQNPEGLSPEPELMFTEAFCTRCGACAKVCPVGAHSFEGGVHTIGRDACTMCGRCVEACLPKALSIVGREMSVEEVVAAALDDNAYYQASGGGVTLSGGEPLAQPEFSEALLAACREKGLHTALDTSLLGDARVLDALLRHTDLVLADLKHLDPSAHVGGTGRTNETIVDNLRRVSVSGTPFVVRIPVVPGFNDTPAAMDAMADMLLSLQGLVRVDLLPFHRLGESKAAGLGKPVATKALKTPVRERMVELSDVLARKGIPVSESFVASLVGDFVDKDRDKDASLDYPARLAAIRATKQRHTEIKRKRGARDVDDWGDVPLEGRAFEFRPETDHPKGYVLGPRDCGRNFRRFLEAVPTYVDPMSSLLGGYYTTFSGYVTGWDPDNYWSDLAPEFKRYGIIHGIDNSQHFVSDVRIGLDLGFGGLLDRIARYRRINTGDDAQAYYDGLTEFVKGIQAWIGRHAADARALAAAETGAEIRANLLAMADANERLMDQPPLTFVEACQWLAWYQMAKRMYIGGGSMGRLDKILLPYFERDVGAGILDEEAAVFHLACFLVKDSHYIQLGGMDEAGNDETNRLSFLFLEAAHRIRIPANLAVAVHAKSDPALVRRGVELLFADKMGTPRFAGLDAMVAGMVRRGFPLETARRRVQCGCHWYCIPGEEYCFNDVIKINFAKVLEVALDEYIADCGVRSAECRDGKNSDLTADGLWEVFERHLRRAVAVTTRGIDFHVEHQYRYYPELALSLLCHGPIEKGVDASHGGVEFVNVGVDGSALATVADSFAAIEQRVERERSVSWSELSCGINQKWWRCGRTRLLLQSVPGYGRGGTRGDWWAERISRLFADLVVERPSPAGHRMTPGLFSWASTIPMGRETGATPDGRGHGEPISFGANPNPGRLRGVLVPTGMSSAIARVHPPYGNAAPLQFDVDPGLISGEDGVATFTALIKTHFALGGTLINANVLDREKVLDACRNPAKYPDLVVRVTGFSAYFASLSDDFRRLVYERVVEVGR